MVGLSAFAGACLSYHHIGFHHLYAMLAATFLSFGCSALNQFQERDLDGMMQRTKKRPLPSGNLMPKEVLVLSVSLILMGMGFIVLSESLSAILIGIFVIVGYNFLYTPFKRISPFSVMLGSFSGAVPPLLGYTMAGGSPFDVKILLVSATLYLWQTPHFAILADMHADDYIQAGFKTLRHSYGEDKSRLFISVWSAAYFAALMFLPLADIYVYKYTMFAHIAVALPAAFIVLFYSDNPRIRFHTLNLSAMMFFLLLAMDSMIVH